MCEKCHASPVTGGIVMVDTGVGWAMDGAAGGDVAAMG